VQIGASGVETNAENIISKRPGPCPRIHRLSSEVSSPSSGSIVLRSGIEPLYLSSDIYFSLTGTLSSKVSLAEVFDDQGRTQLATLDIDGAIVRSEHVLPSGRQYLLRLWLQDRERPIEIPFFVRAEPAKYWSILRVE
jgi:hypothetical protein